MCIYIYVCKSIYITLAPKPKGKIEYMEKLLEFDRGNWLNLASCDCIYNAYVCTLPYIFAMRYVSNTAAILHRDIARYTLAACDRDRVVQRYITGTQIHVAT